MCVGRTGPRTATLSRLVRAPSCIKRGKYRRRAIGASYRSRIANHYSGSKHVFKL